MGDLLLINPFIYILKNARDARELRRANGS